MDIHSQVYCLNWIWNGVSMIVYTVSKISYVCVCFHVCFSIEFGKNHTYIYVSENIVYTVLLTHTAPWKATIVHWFISEREWCRIQTEKVFGKTKIGRSALELMLTYRLPRHNYPSNQFERCGSQVNTHKFYLRSF